MKHARRLGAASALVALVAAFSSSPSAGPARSRFTLLGGPVSFSRSGASGAAQTPHPAPPHKELANRNDWQRPHWVMDVLQIKEGSRVADVGAGSGYFTLHLAGRVGWKGKVYAVEIREDVLAGIREFRKALNLPQIEMVLGADDDPRLPAGSLDVVLVVNAYHEMRAYNRMMQAFLRALKPGGLLAIIDADAKEGSRRAVYFEQHDLPATLVRADAVRNGFRYLRTESGFTNPDDGAKWFFVIFERP